jgi:hypothetical protein
LLSANFALDTTLRELLRILRDRPSEGEVGASSPTDPVSGEQWPRTGEPKRFGTSAPVFALCPSNAADPLPAPKDPRHREFIVAFCTLWEEIRGGKYRVIGARDGAAVKALLRDLPEVGLADWQARVRYALSDDWFRRQGSIATLCSRWSNYLPPAPRSEQPRIGGRRVAVGIDGASGAVLYREET